MNARLDIRDVLEVRVVTVEWPAIDGEEAYVTHDLEVVCEDGTVDITLYGKDSVLDCEDS